MTADWDDYWAEQLADEQGRQHHACKLPMSPVLRVLTGLGAPPAWRSVLVVGCGISTEPAALSYIGYNVVAFDISQVAVAYVASHPATPNQLASWFWLDHDHLLSLDSPGAGATIVRKKPSDPAAIRSILDARRRDGGSLATLRHDFREFPTDRQFDIVYSPWSWQCLETMARAEMARRAFAWVSPGGMCLLATQNLRSEHEAVLHREFAAAGFFERGAQSRAHRCRPPDFASEDEHQRWWRSYLERSSELWRDDTRRALARLAAGERMYDTYNGSG